MKSVTVNLLLLYAVSIQHVHRIQAKLAVHNSPKSSEMLSNALYNTNNNNNNNNKYNDNIDNDNNMFDNECNVCKGIAVDEHEPNINAVEDNRNHNIQSKNNNKSNKNPNKVSNINSKKHKINAANNFVLLQAGGNGGVGVGVGEGEGTKRITEEMTYVRNTAGSNKHKVPATTIATTTTQTKLSSTGPVTNGTERNKTQTTTTTTTRVQTKLDDMSPYHANANGYHSNNHNNHNNNSSNHINRSVYQPYAFINPFGQLNTLFGYDQLHLPDYSFFFNAERDTVFQLHTVAANAAETNASDDENVVATAGGRVLNVVSSSISAAFGVNSGAAASAGITPAIRVEEVQLYNASSLRKSHFNPFNPTRIIIHGWLGSSHASIFGAIIPEYLKSGKGNYNVFSVDWGRGAIADYITASYRVKPVGKVVAKFIDFLHEEAGIRYEDLHVIGFSMGAHVAGIAGKFLQTGRLSVIYALDPALPLFRYDNIDERVSLLDADYVEVIHTSAGTYGYDRPLGHVDFYVNYGYNQPACFFNECSHLRAYLIFAESLRSKVGFYGHGCDVQLWRDLIKQRRCPMGTGLRLLVGGDPKNATALKARGGVYNVLTNASPPYAKR